MRFPSLEVERQGVELVHVVGFAHGKGLLSQVCPHHLQSLHKKGCWQGFLKDSGAQQKQARGERSPNLRGALCARGNSRRTVYEHSHSGQPASFQVSLGAQ